VTAAPPEKLLSYFGFWILDFGFWIKEYLNRQDFWKLKSGKFKPKWYYVNPWNLRK
jgi:hypothetical protein